MNPGIFDANACPWDGGRHEIYMKHVPGTGNVIICRKCGRELGARL